MVVGGCQYLTPSRVIFDGASLDVLFFFFYPTLFSREVWHFFLEIKDFLGEKSFFPVYTENDNFET